jgi:type III secretion system YscQ/HrcQ family protein
LSTKATPVLSLRGRIPAVSPAQMAATNPMFERPWRIAQGDQTWRFQHAGAMQVAEWMQLSGQRTRLLFAPVRDSAQAQVEERAWFDFEGQARLLAFALAFEERIAQLSQCVGEPLLPSLIVATSQLGKLANGMVFLRFSVDSKAGLQAQGYLACPPSTLAQLRDIAYVSAAAPTASLRNVMEQVRVSLQIKSIMISLAEYQTLRSGDVLGLGPRTALVEQGCIHVSGLGFLGAWHCRFNGDGWALTDKALADEFIEMIEGRMINEETNESSAQKAGSQIDQVPDSTDAAVPAVENGADALSQQFEIQLGFELARTNVALQDLAQLQPGYVFKLMAPLEGQNVRILASGRVVGHGELVSVGDFLGVRLLELQ